MLSTDNKRSVILGLALGLLPVSASAMPGSFPWGPDCPGPVYQSASLPDCEMLPDCDPSSINAILGLSGTDCFLTVGGCTGVEYR